MSPLEERIEALEKLTQDLKKSFVDHWKWHQGEQKRIQHAGVTFHEALGVAYAIAPNREAMLQSGYIAGPSPDLWELTRAWHVDGYILVQLSTEGVLAPFAVMECVDGKWRDIPKNRKDSPE